jgi:hypothetical protein
MDYYVTLKVEAEKVIGNFGKAFLDAKKKPAKTKQRLLDENARLGRLEQQKQKLMSLADDSLAGSHNQYEKFKVSLRKLNTEIESTGEAIETLKTRIIPAQERELSETEQKLRSALDVFCRSQQSECENEMTTLLEQVASLQDAWLDAFGRIYKEYGVGFAVRHSGLLPQPKHSRLTEALDFLPTRPVRVEKTARVEAQSAPVEAVEAGTTLEGTVDPPQIPSEPTSQAPEAVSPSGGAVATPETPRITVLTG